MSLRDNLLVSLTLEEHMAWSEPEQEGTGVFFVKDYSDDELADRLQQAFATLEEEAAVIQEVVAEQQRRAGICDECAVPKS